MRFLIGLIAGKRNDPRMALKVTRLLAAGTGFASIALRNEVSLSEPNLIGTNTNENVTMHGALQLLTCTWPPILYEVAFNA